MLDISQASCLDYSLQSSKMTLEEGSKVDPILQIEKAKLGKINWLTQVIQPAGSQTHLKSSGLKMILNTRFLHMTVYESSRTEAKKQSRRPQDADL